MWACAGTMVLSDGCIFKLGGLMIYIVKSSTEVSQIKPLYFVSFGIFSSDEGHYLSVRVITC